MVQGEYEISAERKGRFRATNMVVSRVQIESSNNQHGDFTSDDAKKLMAFTVFPLP